MVDESQISRGLVRRSLEAFAVVLLSVLLLGLVELGLRGVRSWQGESTQTRVERFYRQITAAVGIYRGHAFLNTGPKPGAQIEAFGKVASFNSLGYRSPERALSAPDGTIRIACAGGSTTFDIAAVDDAATWPWRLEGLLKKDLSVDGRNVEVWNGGFPGWTSLENLIALAQRDLELKPQIVLLYQGINDLQPGALTPFDPGYERGHAEIARRALGLHLAPIHWTERILVLEQARDLIQGPDDPWQRLQAEHPSSARLDRLPEAAVDTFRRNIRTFLGIAAAHEIRVVLITQPLRLRALARQSDLDYLDGWLGGLNPQQASRELERLNQVLREMARDNESVDLWDAAELNWQDRHFADPMHFSAEGSVFFAERLSEWLIADHGLTLN